jgi:hypothetical protein
MTYCRRCDRPFSSRHSLEQHLKGKHLRECRHSLTLSIFHTMLRRQHNTDSSHHFICYHCLHKPDFDDEDELDSHLENEHHICVPCWLSFEDSNQLVQHDIAAHHKCNLCGTYYDSASNLQNVRLPH